MNRLDDWFCVPEGAPNRHDLYTETLERWGYLHPRTGECMWEVSMRTRMDDLFRAVYMPTIRRQLAEPLVFLRALESAPQSQ